jgi:hypothetical protein
MTEPLDCLVWSNQRGMWWRPARRGYTGIIDEAGRYTRTEAGAIVADATCNGKLTHQAVDPISGQVRTIMDEVIVPAPEAVR